MSRPSWCRALLSPLLVIVIVACSRAPEPSAGSAETLPDGPVLAMIDVGAARRTIDLTLSILPGTDSMLAWMALHDPIIGLSLARVVAPDGDVWHDEDEDTI